MLLFEIDTAVARFQELETYTVNFLFRTTLIHHALTFSRIWLLFPTEWNYPHEVELSTNFVEITTKNLIM